MNEQITPTQIARPSPTSRLQAHRKVLSWFAWLLLLLFWENLLDLTLHVLHIVLEYLELALEETLEMLFHLENYTAQMYTAWIGSTLLIVLAAFIYYRISRSIRQRFRSWTYFRIWLKVSLRENWLYLSLLLLVYLASELLV